MKLASASESVSVRCDAGLFIVGRFDRLVRARNGSSRCSPIMLPRTPLLIESFASCIRCLVLSMVRGAAAEEKAPEEAPAVRKRGRPPKKRTDGGLAGKENVAEAATDCTGATPHAASSGGSVAKESSSSSTSPTVSSVSDSGSSPKQGPESDGEGSKKSGKRKKRTVRVYPRDFLFFPNRNRA